jgi:hypothetical protein
MQSSFTLRTPVTYTDHLSIRFTPITFFYSGHKSWFYFIGRIIQYLGDHRGCYCIVVRFTTAYANSAISAYHRWGFIHDSGLVQGSFYTGFIQDSGLVQGSFYTGFWLVQGSFYTGFWIGSGFFFWTYSKTFKKEPWTKPESCIKPV